MLENYVKFTAKVDDKESYWYVANGMPLDIAEKMALQFVQFIEQIKVQQKTQAEQNAQEPDQPKE